MRKIKDRLKYYSNEVGRLPPEMIIKKTFKKIKDKGWDTIGRMSANLFGTEMTNEEFLRKASKVKR